MGRCDKVGGCGRRGKRGGRKKKKKKVGIAATIE